MIGTDLEAIRDAIHIEGEMHVFPLTSLTPYHTPIDELPESAQVLFSHDTALAKQMLADEGYSDGFPMKINVLVDWPGNPEAAQILMEQWAPLGIEVDIELNDWPTWAALNRENEIEDSYAAAMVSCAPLITFRALGIDQTEWFWNGYDDEYLTAQYYKAKGTSDAAERAAIWTELSIYFLEDVPFIPLGSPYLMNSYWPWVKNYYSELECGYYNWQPIYGFCGT